MKCNLTIQTGYKNGKTYIKDTFFTRPIRVADTGLYEEDDGLYLIFMNSSPGILDGDEYDLSICLEENSRLQIRSQSYQRLFNMKTGASQKLRVQLDNNCTFSYVPHPVVPHKNAKFKNHSVIQMGDNCNLILSEILTCGRKLCGEVFEFSHFHNLTEVYHHQRLIMKDNIVLEPQIHPLNTIIQLESYTHQATFIHISTREESVQAFIQPIYDLLSLEKDIIFGISEMAENGFILRVLGNGGEQLYDCFQSLQELLWPNKQDSVPHLIHEPISLD
jgi:urease accessory protein